MKAKAAKEMRKTPCVACGKTPTDIAHVRSKKASGINKKWNLVSLCRTDHALQHLTGWRLFFQKYPHVKKHLENSGWEFEELMGRFLMFHKSDEE